MRESALAFVIACEGLHGSAGSTPWRVGALSRFCTAPLSVRDEWTVTRLVTDAGDEGLCVSQVKTSE